MTDNQGITLFDEDGNWHHKLQLREESTWISYEEMPEMLTEIVPESLGIWEKLWTWFEFQSGQYREKTCTGMLIREAQKHGILEELAGTTTILQKQILSGQLGKKYSKKYIVEMLLNTMDFGNGIYGLEAASKAYEGCGFTDLPDEKLKNLCGIAEKIITQEEYPDGGLVNRQTSYYSADAFCDGVIKQLITDLKENGYTTEEAAEKLFFDGGSVKTTLNQELQQVVNEKYAESDTFTTLSSGRYIQSAMVILDYQGKIKAVAGGNAGNTIINRALSVQRQIGSTIKPFAIYAPAIDRGIINYSSVIQDAPIQISNEDGLVDWPENYDGKYEQNVTMDKLASCYSIFGNDGLYTEPSIYTELSDQNGRSVLRKEPESRQAISTAAAEVMNRLLKANVEEPGALAQEAAVEGVEVLGKTGTVGVNDEVKCQYFVGMTSEYIACIWIGFDGEETLNLKNYKHAASIWKTVMEEVSRGTADFRISDEIEEREYCLKTGMLATEACEETAVGWYEKNRILDECRKCREY